MTDAKAALKADLSGLARKLPVQATATARLFALAGSVDEPTGRDPVRLVAPDSGKPEGPLSGSGQAVLVRLALTNKADKDIVGQARLGRSPFMHYPVGLWPKGDGGEFYKGIYEVAGTKGLSWQYFNKHGNEPYQVLGFLLLNGGASAKVTGLTLPGGYGDRFWAARRELSLPAGGRLELPVLLVSVPCSDPAGAKPKLPDLAKIIEQLKPELVKATEQ